jgi:NAD(P)H dehydrogenase (quinone)
VNVLVVLAHPDASSFNHALAQAVAAAARGEGHAVVLRDLYAERFDPLLSRAELERDAPLEPWLRRHCDELAAADGIVIVHPNWWGQPPAILKGWIDRVVRPGVAYAFVEGDQGEGVPVGLLRARTAVVLNTSNTPSAREREAFGDPLESIWKRCVFDLCGVKDVRRRTYGVVVTSTPELRARWLEDARGLVRAAFPCAAASAPPSAAR